MTKKDNDVIITRFGRAKIGNHGYYQITSKNEGNMGKYLHRLIYEDYYGPIPERFHVHHKNGIKTDNNIDNLELMSDSQHRKLHMEGENNPMYGIELSDEHKRKISKSQNSTGYFRVYKNKNDNYKQGFRFVYRYYEDGKRKLISSVDIKKLEKKVKAKGLKWLKFEQEKGG